MRNNIVFIVILFIINPLLLSGQEEESQIIESLNFGAGYSHMRMLDRSATQLVYASNSIPIVGGYTKQTDKSVFMASISLEPGLVGSAGEFKDRKALISQTNSSGNLETVELNIGNTVNYKDQLTVSWFHQLWGHPGSKFNLYAGGSFIQYFFLSFSMVPVLFHSEISLNPSVFAAYRVNPSTNIHGSIAFPLVGLNTHLPFSNDPVDGEHNHFYVTYDTGSKVVSPLDYQKVNLSFELEKQLNSTLSFSVSYRFYWFQYSDQSTFNAYDNCISLNLKNKINS
ncbi:MAG: hypothetical protein JW801_15155 [Bacteroidales bacterium]|nr:hypothetical protein [Bacteroidales bacterium]